MFMLNLELTSLPDCTKGQKLDVVHQAPPVHQHSFHEQGKVTCTWHGWHLDSTKNSECTCSHHAAQNGPNEQND